MVGTGGIRYDDVAQAGSDRDLNPVGEVRGCPDLDAGIAACIADAEAARDSLGRLDGEVIRAAG